MMTKRTLMLFAAVTFAVGLFLTSLPNSSARVLTEQESSKVLGAQGLFQCVMMAISSECQPIQGCLSKVCDDFGGSTIGSTCNGAAAREAIPDRTFVGCQSSGAELASFCVQISDCFGVNQCSTIVTLCMTDFDEDQQIWICKENPNWSGSVSQATAPLSCASTGSGGPTGE